MVMISENLLRANAMAVLQSMGKASCDKYHEAWGRIEMAIRDTAPKGAKVFEVHHSVEHARLQFFADVVAGKPPAACGLAADAGVTCILTAENMHTVDDCAQHDHEVGD